MEIEKISCDDSGMGNFELKTMQNGFSSKGKLLLFSSPDGSGYPTGRFWNEVEKPAEE